MITSQAPPLYILGLDFGTSNLRLQRAVLNDAGALVVPPAPVALVGSSFDALPCVLELTPDGNSLRTYGQAAVNDLQVTQTPQHYVQDFKPCLGQAPNDPASQGPKAALFDYSRDDAFRYADLLLERVVANLLTIYGQAPTAANRYKVLAGVPIYWQEDTCLRYRRMLTDRFGNEQVQLVPEPEAALNYHLCQHSIPSLPPDGRVLTVDFGAGTTDVSLCGISEDGRHLVEPLFYGERYGGADFDAVLGEYIARRLQMPPSGDRAAALQLREAGRRLKENYSQAVAQGKDEGASVHSLMSGDRVYDGLVRLDRETFESGAVAGTLIREFDALLARAVAHFGRAASAVSLVVATGGGAQWYFVRECLERRFMGRPVVGDQPHKAIAMGLAYPSLQIMPPTLGSDYRLAHDLTWEEASRGGRATVSVEGRPEEVAYPAGVTNGEEIRVPGKGGRGRYGGTAGTLIVTLRVAPAVAGEHGADVRRVLVLSGDEARQGATKALALGGVTVNVPVPPGVVSGRELRLPGGGQPGRHGGPPGDLVVTIQVAPTLAQNVMLASPVRGQDVRMDLPLTAEQARSGGNCSVRVGGMTLDVPVPPGTFAGQEMRLPGRGLPGLNGGPPGDLIVTMRLGSPSVVPARRTLPAWLVPAAVVSVLILALAAYALLRPSPRPLVPPTVAGPGPVDYSRMTAWETLLPQGWTSTTRDEDSAYTLAFPTNDTLAVGYWDGSNNANPNQQLMLWNVDNKKVLPPQFDTTWLHVHALAASASGHDIAVVGYDTRPGRSKQVLLVVDAQSGQQIIERDFSSALSIRSVAYSPIGNTIAVGCVNNADFPIKTDTPYKNNKDYQGPNVPDNVSLWDGSTGIESAYFKTGWPALALAFTPGSKFLDIGHVGFVNICSITKNGNSVEFGSTGKTAVLNGENGYLDKTISFDGSGSAPYPNYLNSSLAISPKGETLVVGTRSVLSDDKVSLLNTTDHRCRPLSDPSVQYVYIQAVAFSPDGTTIAVGGNVEVGKTLLGKVTLWNAQTGALIGQPLPAHDNDVDSVAFSPNGRMLACGSDDGTVKLWHVP